MGGEFRFRCFDFHGAGGEPLVAIRFFDFPLLPPESMPSAPINSDVQIRSLQKVHFLQKILFGRVYPIVFLTGSLTRLKQ